MDNIHVYIAYNILIINHNNLFNISKINTHINEIFLKLNIHSDVNRVISLNEEFCCVGSYDKISNMDLLYIITSLYSNYNYIHHDYIPHDVLIKFEKDLPKINKYSHCICGGKTTDSQKIDEGILPLCASLNNIEGIKTFSSCHGHSNVNNECTAYVLFTIENMDILKDISYKLDELCNKYYKIIDEYNTDVSFLFNYGHWENIQNVYFEIRIKYYYVHQEKIFQYINTIAKELYL